MTTHNRAKTSSAFGGFCFGMFTANISAGGALILSPMGHAANQFGWLLIFIFGLPFGLAAFFTFFRIRLSVRTWDNEV